MLVQLATLNRLLGPRLRSSLVALSSPLQPVRLPNIPVDFKSLSLSAARASSGQSDPFADATKRERLNAILGMKVTNTIFRPTSLSPEVREKR